ncbi:hypothetical protein M0802_007959 [Mischocyttarus mexicanus]|nr:hypothetical protein M0802_007959 [Mischocyttarus mexicanus]
MENNRLDVIIFGATGFSGKYVVKEAARCVKEKNFTFGISGRRKEALESVLKTYAPDLDVPIYIADVKDEQSLNKMAEKAKVLINCCGPFTLYGESTIKACIAAKTHYVDITGESLFIEEMELKYNQAAQKAGIYIISACGFDSIPSDLGIIFAQQKFNGEVNSIEEYISILDHVKIKKPLVNYGTWESLINVLGNIDKLRENRRKLYPKKLPELKPKLNVRTVLPHKSPFTNDFSIVFRGSDYSIINRTQRFLYQESNQRPAQVAVYLSIKTTFLTKIITMFLLLTNLVLSKCAFGRSLLLKHPKFFTYGLISHEEPNEKSLNELEFCMHFLVRGWTEKLSEPTDVHSNPPNKEMITKVTGANVYFVTAIGVLLSALTICKESDKMPSGGGVLTTGAAFGKTSLIDELHNQGLKFEVVSSIEK